MAKQFKEGDICIVLGAKQFPENNGKAVTLLEYVPSGVRVSYEDIPFSPPPEDSWVVSGDNIHTVIMGIATTTSIAGFLQSKLIKIGDQDPDLTKTAEKERPVVDLVSA